jgi:N-formylglutamate amidohydrolase
MKLNRYIVDVVREPVDLELLSSKIAQDIGTSMSAVNLEAVTISL